MTQTDFLHLNKPADSDAINISAQNTNTLMFARHSDEPETDSAEPETEG